MKETLEEKFTPASLTVAQAYFTQLRADLQAGRSPGNCRQELEYHCKNGSTVWTEVMIQPVLRADGTVVELLGVTRSIAEHKRLLQELQNAKADTERVNAELLSLATTDSLTNVWNRRYFELTAATAIANAQRYQHPVSIVVFDVDHFKAINDRHGHQAGDQVLVELTQVVRRVLRMTDMLARWGGEEFVVIVEHCDAAAATQLADKIRKAVAAHKFAVAGNVTISLGVAALRAGETPDTWFGRADQAMFDAKNNGRNTVRCSQ